MELSMCLPAEKQKRIKVPMIYWTMDDRETQKKRSRLRVNADRVQFLDRRNASAPMDGDGYAPRQAAPRPAQASRPAPQRRQAPQQDSYEDLGPAFPSEASTMDDIPF